jgi:hypothetical protein
MTHRFGNCQFKSQAFKAQSLSEYLLIALLLGGLGLVGVVGFNGGIQAVFNQLKTQLLAGRAANVTNQTNQQIATAQQAVVAAPKPITAPTVPPPSGPATPSPSPSAELQSLSTLLTSMDPANLPEVSGSNSTLDITQVVASANTLVNQAAALENAAKKDSGLNVSDLVFEARKVAAAQFFLAGVLTEGPGTVEAKTGRRLITGPNVSQGLALLELIIAQKPNDPEAQKFYEYYQHDYFAYRGVLPATFNEIGQGQKQQIDGYSFDFNLAYQPLKSTIEQLNIQTQQANTVKNKGGNINNNANAKGNANQTLQDANAINACQNATCN